MSEPAKIFSISEAPVSPSNPQFWTQLLVVALGSFVLGLASYLSYRWFVVAQSHLETNNAYIESDVFHVQSRMMGFTKDILVEEGQAVKKGDTLLRLDDTEVLVEQSFKAAKLKKATADFSRGRLLVKAKLISVSDFELLEASLAAAVADENATKLKMKYTQIVSPTNGVIAKAYVKSGQFIQPGQNIMTVVAGEKYWIKANYKETQIEKIQVGQPVKIEIDAYPGHEFSGRVEGVYPSSGAVTSLLPAENSTGNFTKVVQRVSVKISIAGQPKYELRPGMSVVTVIDTVAESEK